MKVKVIRDGLRYKGEPQKKGTIIESDNDQHIGALLAGGAVIFKGEIPKQEPKPAPKKKVSKSD
jgi:formylmethanofuran dehydrogenase subunit C